MDIDHRRISMASRTPCIVWILFSEASHSAWISVLSALDVSIGEISGASSLPIPAVRFMFLSTLPCELDVSLHRRQVDVEQVEESRRSSEMSWRRDHCGAYAFLTSRITHRRGL